MAPTAEKKRKVGSDYGNEGNSERLDDMTHETLSGEGLFMHDTVLNDSGKLLSDEMYSE